jgi:hypothetical protein
MRQDPRKMLLNINSGQETPETIWDNYALLLEAG